MIGLIVVGHGDFSKGLTSALELIAGPAKEYAYVTFKENDSLEDLRKNIQCALSLFKKDQPLLILSDIAGGSPFKTAVECTIHRNQCQVLAGMNLPMLIEVNFIRQTMTSLEELVDRALEVGKEQVVRYQYQERKEEIVEDGI